jgi:hypothetical protein
VSWDDGCLTHGLYTAGEAPDWFATGSFSGARPTAARAETAGLVAGLYAGLNGSERTVVVLDRVPALAVEPTDTEPALILEPERWIYGRITSEEMSLDTVRGDEGSADTPEQVRITTIRVEEEQ